LGSMTAYHSLLLRHKMLEATETEPQHCRSIHQKTLKPTSRQQTATCRATCGLQERWSTKACRCGCQCSWAT
jgi:hypothetical protein